MFKCATFSSFAQNPNLWLTSASSPEQQATLISHASSKYVSLNLFFLYLLFFLLNLGCLLCPSQILHGVDSRDGSKTRSGLPLCHPGPFHAWKRHHHELRTGGSTLEISPAVTLLCVFRYLANIFNIDKSIVSHSFQVELFEKDIEYIKTELNHVSAADTSPISLYEYFHISPIKVCTGARTRWQKYRKKHLYFGCIYSW